VAAEHVLDRHRAGPAIASRRRRGPLDVFHRNILCCFIDEPVVWPTSVHSTSTTCSGVGLPHSDGTWPNAPEVLTETFAGLKDEQINKITH